MTYKEIYDFKLKEGWANTFYKNANEAWENLYLGLNEEGDEYSPRGIKVKETLGCNIYIMDTNDNLVFNTFRGLSPIYLAKEYFWYKSGDNSVEKASKLSKFWSTLANEDGTVNSNYGHYIFVPESDGKTVWEKTVEILRKDPDSRQAIIQIPIMRARGTKDTPCTSSIQFFIREGKLFATVYMRSTDVVLGFPIDIFQFTMWQNEMAAELGVETGWMRFISGNIHCYEKNWINNVDDTFRFTRRKIDNENEEKVSIKSSDKFKTDLTNLNLHGSNLDPDEVLFDPLLALMFKNRKIWK